MNPLTAWLAWHGDEYKTQTKQNVPRLFSVYYTNPSAGLCSVTYRVRLVWYVNITQRECTNSSSVNHQNQYENRLTFVVLTCKYRET